MTREPFDKRSGGEWRKRAERAEKVLQAWLDLGLGCTCKPESGCAAAIVREQARAVLAEVPR